MSTPNNPTPPPPPPPATPKENLRLPWIVAGVFGLFAFLMFLGHCSHSDQGKNPPTSATATTPTSATATSSAAIDGGGGSATAAPATTTAPQGPQPPAYVRELTFDVKPGPDGDIVTATYKIGENFTKGLTKDSARIETMDILKYALQAYPNAVEFDVHAMADMVDTYGRTSVDQVATLIYMRDSLDKINWQNFDFANIWNVPICLPVYIDPALLY